MFSVVLLAIALIGAGMTIAYRKLQGIARIDMLAVWLLACPIGLGGIWAFIGHALFPARVAESIGWPTSPFQWEIAVANLAMGALGLLSIVFRERFRLAAAIACNIYLLGCAAGHIHQAIAHANYSINNIGPILWIGDIFTPLLILLLALLSDWRRRTSSVDIPLA